MPAGRHAQGAKEERRSSGAARKKRPAFNLTCANCRRRKMRCDSGQPGCLICAAYGDVCQYDKPPPMSQVVTMAKRLQHLEEAMAQLKSSDNEDILRVLDRVEVSSASPRDKTSPHASEASNSTHDMPTNDSSTGRRGRGSMDSTIPALLSELSMSADGQLRYYGSTSAVHQPVEPSQTPSTSLPAELVKDDSRSLLVSNAHQSRGWEDYALGNASLQLNVPREIITKLLDTHWTWIHPTFMFVYRPAFMSDMSNGGPYYSVFLLSVMCSHSTRFIERHLGELLVSRAQQSLGEAILGDSSIPTVQALLQFSARAIGQGLISQAWLYSGMAFRMSTDLGLHLSTERISDLGHLNPQDKEIRIRLSWSCYLWDKAMSLYLGRAPTIIEPPLDEPSFLDDFAETEPWTPTSMDESETLKIEYPLTQSHSISCFTNFCKLNMIINDVITHLYSTSRESTDNITPFVYRARTRLEEWRASSEPHLVMDPNNLPFSCPPTHILTQNILYYTTIILLHKPLHNVTFARSSSRDASKAIEAIILSLENTFGLTRITYLMSYCIYTGATIAVEDLNEGCEGAMSRVQTFIRALEGAKTTCPIVQRSLDIIHKNMLRHSQEHAQMLSPHKGRIPDETLLQHVMPAFPYQQYQIDVVGQPDVYPLDQSMYSSTLNSYPQHYLDVRDGNWPS